MNGPTNIAVVGAGIVGLSTALTLQNAGFAVTLFDRAEPGMGASYGNAGVFADYARLPFASFNYLLQAPGMLMDSNSPLSIRRSHVTKMLPYGLRFARAALPAHYRSGGDALTALSELAQVADRALWDLAGANELIGTNGCLALFGSENGMAKAYAGHIQERADRGVDLERLSAHDVHDLEPDLLPFYAGGVRYNKTRFAKNPYLLSERYFKRFCELGGRFKRVEIRDIGVENHGASVEHSGGTDSFDAVVLSAGVASRGLAERLGTSAPIVSERGYHLMLDSAGQTLGRPVVWLDKSVFLTPMSDGVRVAGTAEFADPDDLPSPSRTALMLRTAQAMLGDRVASKNEWIGCRPSSPDSLPVIGFSPKSQRIIYAFGHGHLGLSLSAATGEMVKQLLSGTALDTVFKAVSPNRFQ
jgi:glycine/D-amino acid oxidase-like deaminating enzyme